MIFQKNPPEFDYNHLREAQISSEALMMDVVDHGFSLVRNVPVEEGAVKKFVEEVFGLCVQRTIYGKVISSENCEKCRFLELVC